VVLRAVLFDLDDTLLADADSAELAVVRTAQGARSLGIDPLALAAALRRRSHELWRAAPTGSECHRLGISSLEGLSASFTGDDELSSRLRKESPGYRQAAWAGALESCGVDPAVAADAATQLAERFPIEYRSHFELFADTIPALDALAPLYRIGLVSNGPSDLQREKLTATRIDSYFDTVVISGEIGVGKPAPEAFLAALDTVRVPAREAVMVGNSLVRDVAGARRAGLHALWLDRLGTLPAPSPNGEVSDEWSDGGSRGRGPAGGGRAAPDALIGSLEELAGVLPLIGSTPA
jgi:putative hydrolase of the HAD superfamily